MDNYLNTPKDTRPTNASSSTEFDPTENTTYGLEEPVDIVEKTAEHIAQYKHGQNWAGLWKSEQLQAIDCAKSLLSMLEGLGVVRLAEDQSYEYAHNPYSKDVNLSEGVYEGLRHGSYSLGIHAQSGLMVETGFKRVIPLLFPLPEGREG